MLPLLARLGPFELASFGVVIAAGFIVFSFTLWREARDRGIPESPLFDHLLVTTVAALLGARIFFVVTHWTFFREQLLRILVIWRFPGLSELGAFFAGLLTVILYAKKLKLPSGIIFDIYGKALPIAVFFVSLAVFLDGSVIGKESSLFWALPAVGVTGKRHPVGLYGMIAAVAMALVLLGVASYLNRHKINKSGFTGWLSLSLFGGVQFVLAIFRADLLYFTGVAVEQLIAVITMMVPLGPMFTLTGGRQRLAHMWQGMRKWLH